MASQRRPSSDRALAGALALLAASVHMLTSCTSCGDRTCRAYSNDDLARFASDPWCEAIAVYESSLETLDGLQGADKNVALVSNQSLMDVSAIDSARYVELIDSPTEDIVMTAAGLYIGGVPLRTAHIGLRWPVPHEPLDPDEPFPEILNQVRLGVSGDGPSDLALECVGSGCRASISIHAAALNGPVITTAGVQVVELGLDAAPLTSWEFLQGFGVPEQEIRLSAPQDLAIIRQWRAWLNENGFAGSLGVCEPAQECVEVTASEP